MVRIPQGIKDFLGLSDNVKRLVKISIGMIFFFEIIKVFPPFIFQNIIDAMVSYDPAVGVSVNLLAWLLGGYLFSMLFMTIIECLTRFVLINQIHRTDTDLMSKIVGKLLFLDVVYHENHNTGASMSKIFRGSGRIVELLFNYIDTLMPVVCQTLITLVILSFYSWHITVIFFPFILLFMFILTKEMYITQKYREDLHEQFELFAGSVTQSISNVRTVKDFHNEDKELKKSNHFLDRYLHAGNMRTKIGVYGSFVESTLISIARVLTLAISVWLMTEQRISPGELVFIITMSEKAYINLQRLGRLYFLMQDAAPSISRFVKIKNEPIIVKDNPNSPLKIMDGSIEFKNISFAYNKKQTALKDISFLIKPRSVTALVGRSGSGKSTAVNLILRHFDPTRGAIFLDGKNAKDYSLDNLRSSISIVSQDVELFNESVHANIAYGAKKASRKDVIEAAKLAHAHEFIEKLEKGYDTLIGEDGIRLSGGQKQRLAIARAIIRKPKILIFDEATSSLDAESERFIHKSIVSLMGKLTLIIIAHRFSTIQSADNIILLEKGHVKEIGTHQELIRKKGIFAKLRQLQSLEEIKDEINH